MTRSKERRRCERLPIKGNVAFRRVRETSYGVPLRDVSPGGCSVDLAARLHAGERTWVRLPGIAPIAATVCWAQEWTAGVSFDQPVHPAVFDMVVGRIR